MILFLHCLCVSRFNIYSLIHFTFAISACAAAVCMSKYHNNQVKASFTNSNKTIEMMMNAKFKNRESENVAANTVRTIKFMFVLVCVCVSIKWKKTRIAIILTH